MAIVRYVYAENDADWIDTAAARIEKGDKGAIHVSLTVWTASTESSIAAGSYFEIAGSGYYATGDTAVTGSEATGVNIIYATGATIAASIAYSATAPVWRDDHQGWYQTAASSIRAIASVHFDGGTTYSQKKVYSNNYTLTDKNANEVVAIQMQTKSVNINDSLADGATLECSCPSLDFTPTALEAVSIQMSPTDSHPQYMLCYPGQSDVAPLITIRNIAFDTAEVKVTIENESGATQYVEYMTVTVVRAP